MRSGSLGREIFELAPTPRRGEIRCAPMASSSRDDPSSATKAELAQRSAEVINGGVVPTLRHLHKSAASPLLQQTISTFVDYEKTVTSTAEMLGKIEASMGELESSLAQVQATIQRPGPDG